MKNPTMLLRVIAKTIADVLLRHYIYNLDSERYMAKACAYLCRQCCFIDGFGEFMMASDKRQSCGIVECTV